MFEFLFSYQSKKGIYKAIKGISPDATTIVPLIWTEHCVECSAPECYQTCQKFKKRSDGHCVRIVGGISPVVRAGQIGAHIEFRRWAKIESPLKVQAISRSAYIRLYTWITRLGYLVELIASLCPKRVAAFIHAGWYSYRQKAINYIIRNKKAEEALTLRTEVKNEHAPTKLLIDIKTTDQLLFREAVNIPVGTTGIEVNIPPITIPDTICFINIHPVNPDEHVALDFSEIALVPTDKTKGKKVKCVIWDLDNTLWDGVLIEDRHVTPRKDLLDFIRHLDSCGIVNSIASKNNAEDVEKVLEKLQISDLFVFKKINWDPKSKNVSTTIRQMNINPDTIVFVDDNPFERCEVAVAQPKITCVDPSEIIDLSKCDRFNVVITDDAKNRRKTYQMMEALQDEEEKWEGDIDDFLRSCNIQLILSKPDDSNITRCHELLQRTNQLNSSGRRLSLEEVREIVSNSTYDTYVLNSSDRFGDYGIVGFIIIEKRTDGNYITDFVISCRVANKKIEPSLINYLSLLYGGKVYFNYKKTNLNGPMFKVIEELDMKLISDMNGISIYSCSHKTDYPNIVRIMPV